GDLAMLQRLGPRFGYEASALDLVVTDGHEKISSTRIRQALQRGDVEWAAWALERPHEVEGEVVHSDHRGRTIGFPTANVDVAPSICIPGDGLYAGWVHLRGARLPAVVYIGPRPTFYADAGRSLVEAHLFEFEDDIYGEHMTVEFWHHLRP